MFMESLEKVNCHVDFQRCVCVFFNGHAISPLSERGTLLNDIK